MFIDDSVVCLTAEHDFKGIRFLFNNTIINSISVEYVLTGAMTFCCDKDEDLDGVDIDLNIFKDYFVEEALADLKSNVENDSELMGTVSLTDKTVYFNSK